LYNQFIEKFMDILSTNFVQGKLEENKFQIIMKDKIANSSILFTFLFRQIQKTVSLSFMVIFEQKISFSYFKPFIFFGNVKRCVHSYFLLRS
jgi:hypothetical protein